MIMREREREREKRRERERKRQEREREERERREREREDREREKTEREREREEREREALLLKAPARSGLPSPFNSKDKATKTFFPWDGDFLVDSCTFLGGLVGWSCSKRKNRASPTPPCSW